MKRFKFLVFILLLLSSKGLFAEIIEIMSIEEILTYIDENTLVVFDVDNTLITPKQMLGSDSWFQNTHQKFVLEGYSQMEAHAKLLPYNMKVQNIMEVEPVEPITPALVHTLQKKGNRVIALTSRCLQLAYKTVEQLASVHIHFNKNPPKCQKAKISSHFPLSYIEGILFASNNNKGDLLLTLANELNFEINKICFVDDKLIYLLQMEKACETYRIPFIGFRYGGCDKRSLSFDADVAGVQLKYLEKILSNEDADKILQEKRERGL